MTLPKSPIVFDQSSHTYTKPDGTTLSGVTSLLSRRLFPDKYADVDPDILEAARQRGTAVHEKIELYHSIGAYADDSEVLRYRDAHESALPTYHVVETEYIVSDMEHVASAIDTVLQSDTDPEDYIIDDTKTTSELDIDYVTWQLSVYAYLFHLQTGIMPRRAIVTWLPRNHRHRVVELRLYPIEAVRELILADAQDREFTPPPSPNDTAHVYTSDPVLQRFISLRQQRDSIDRQIDEIQPQVTDILRQAYNTGIFNIKFGGDTPCALRFKPAGTRSSFDSHRFAADFPELYEQYSKKSPTKESITFNFPKQ